MTQNEIATLLKTDEPNRLQFLPALFEDSSHQIVLQSFQDRVEVIKIMRSESASIFWQGMNQLFGVSLASQLSTFERLYPWLAQKTALPLPKWLQTLTNAKGQAHAVRASFLKGEAIESQPVQKPMVEQLAKHLAQWHRVRSDRFGGVFGSDLAPQLAAENWPNRLKRVLETLPETTPAEVHLKQQTLHQLSATPTAFNPTQFALIMPDLRWDQFLSNGHFLTGLTDLDAVVFGPVELEWVLLEVILNQQQAQWFLQAYPATPPDLAQVRQVYRMALCQLQVLGHQSPQAWLNFPTWFD